MIQTHIFLKNKEMDPQKATAMLEWPDGKPQLSILLTLK